MKVSRTVRAGLFIVLSFSVQIISTNVFAYDKDVFQTFIYNRGEVNADEKDVGYLAGSIGAVVGSKLSSKFESADFVLTRKFEVNPYITIKFTQGGVEGHEIDLRTRDYEVATFLIPVKAGEYYINGIHQYDETGKDSNSVPFTAEVKVKPGQITYIGQYLAHQGPVFTVNNEIQRDHDLIEKRTGEKVDGFKLSYPDFTGAASNYFPVINYQYFEKLKEYRDPDFVEYEMRRKKELDEMTNI